MTLNLIAVFVRKEKFTARNKGGVARQENRQQSLTGHTAIR